MKVRPAQIWRKYTRRLRFRNFPLELHYRHSQDEREPGAPGTRRQPSDSIPLTERANAAMPHDPTQPRLTRRELLHAVAGLLGAGCLCPSLRGSTPIATGCATPELAPEIYAVAADGVHVDLRRATALGAIPSAALLVVPDREMHLIIVRRARRQFFALSRFCTHAGQVLSFLPKRGVLQCNNFNHSIFDLEGRVVKGPAERPLLSYPVDVSGSTLRIGWRGQEIT